jgi:hypothetical protein
MQYLDDKTKDKSLEEEMKKTYGIERGSKGIIIKRISEPVTILEQISWLQITKEMSQG